MNLKRWDALNIGQLSKLERAAPSVDMFEDEKEIVFTAELPGVHKDDLKLSVSEKGLRLGAEHSERKEQERHGRHFVMHSSASRFEGFSQYWSFPCAVDASKARATFKNGVLEVRVPKMHADKRGKHVRIS